MKPEAVPVVAIDGPSSSGKGTVALRLAAKLGFHLLDSGALYRLVGLAARRQGIDAGDEPRLARLAEDLDLHFATCRDAAQQVLLQGEDVTALLRTDEASRDASLVAALPGVRAGLMSRQQAFRAPPGLVADGRDMGTQVFPDARVKIFLTASPEVRAERRHAQLKIRALDASLALTLESIQERDRKDLHRSASPLRPAEDARVLDTTHLGIEEVFSAVIKVVQAAGLGTA